MSNANLDYIMDIFKTLVTELPEHMLYRENGDSIELKTLDSIGNSMMQDLQNNGWNLIGTQITAAA